MPEPEFRAQTTRRGLDTEAAHAGGGLRDAHGRVAGNPWSASSKGEAGVSIGALAMSLLALGELGRLEDLLDVSRDETGLLLALDNLPRRKPRLG